MADCYGSRRRVLENVAVVAVICIVFFGVASLPDMFPDSFDRVRVCSSTITTHVTKGPDKTNTLPYHFAVSSSDDYTTNYGYDILAKGGNVFDAIVGMQYVVVLK